MPDRPPVGKKTIDISVNWPEDRVKIHVFENARRCHFSVVAGMSAVLSRQIADDNPFHLSPKVAA